MGHKHLIPRNYSNAGFEFILQALAFHGTARKALKAMEQMDDDELLACGVDHLPDQSTLNRWPTLYAERYAAIRDDKTLQLRRGRAADAHDSHADNELEVSGMILEQLKGKVKQLDPRDLAGALRNTDTGAAINRDKALALTGDSPGGVSVSINISDSIRAMGAKGGQFFDENNQPISMEAAIERAKAIPGTAEEVKEGDPANA